MEFPISNAPSLSNQTGQSQNNSSISQVSVGSNALQGDASTTVNLVADTGDSGGEQQHNRLGAQFEQAVSAQETLNDMQPKGRRVDINFNSELNKLLLQVVDTRTDEVVETIPPETLVRHLKDQVAPPETLEETLNASSAVDKEV
ncbi:MAG: flagellar protein FlaG [Pseudomonadota bacterium]|nr:flagellar protein FlaG [Pseudomonadota bacterium]|tara:strand:+ start:343 stop:777 length:435 start_codon:yes stop_codon:yes gene_type:complete